MMKCSLRSSICVSILFIILPVLVFAINWELPAGEWKTDEIRLVIKAKNEIELCEKKECVTGTYETSITKMGDYHVKFTPSNTQKIMDVDFKLGTQVSLTFGFSWIRKGDVEQEYLQFCIFSEQGKPDNACKEFFGATKQASPQSFGPAIPGEKINAPDMPANGD